MSHTRLATGHCLCGAVTITATISTAFGVCHCGMCRQWGGGPLFSIDVEGVPEFQGEENITVYHSSEWAERAFCRTCGSHLFYRLTGKILYYNMPVGLFDDVTKLTFKTQIYIDKKPCYYEFANQTKNMTEAEVIALFAPKE